MKKENKFKAKLYFDVTILCVKINWEKCKESNAKVVQVHLSVVISNWKLHKWFDAIYLPKVEEKKKEIAQVLVDDAQNSARKV